jgi:hypothetical protein
MRIISLFMLLLAFPGAVVNTHIRTGLFHRTFKPAPLQGGFDGSDI